MFIFTFTPSPYLYRFPFFAADVLASNAMILQALLEGGWSQEKEEDTSATEASTTAGDKDDGDVAALFEQ